MIYEKWKQDIIYRLKSEDKRKKKQRYIPALFLQQSAVMHNEKKSAQA